MRTALKSWFLNSGGGSLAINAPKISVYSKDQTTAFPFWTYNGDAPYTLQRDTDSGFSSPTELYSGSNLSYSDSGLSGGTTYYYRVKSNGSDWDSISVTTFSFNPELFYFPEGIQPGVDNAFGDTVTTTGFVEKLKPQVNASGPDLTIGSWWTSGQRKNLSAYIGIKSPTSSSPVLSTPINLTGDFTILVKISIEATPSNHYLWENTLNANQYIRFQNLTTLQFRIGTSGVLSQAFATAFVVGGPQRELVIKRVGTNLYISIDGGANYGAAVNVGTSTHTIDKMARNLSANMGFICVASSALTTAQCREVFDIYKMSTYQQRATSASPTAKNISFPTSLVSGGYFGTDVSQPLNAIGSYWRWPLLVKGNLAFINGNKQPASPTYSEDGLYVWDKAQGKVTDFIGLGVPVNNTDVHNKGSIRIQDNTISHIEHSVHYTEGTYSKLVHKVLGDNFDFSNVQTLPTMKGVDGGLLSYGQYAQGNCYNDLDQIVYQDWSVTNSQGQYLSYASSNDRWNSANRIRFMDTGGAPSWFYFQVPYAEDGVVRVIWVDDVNGSPDRYAGCGYVETIDNGTTWRNKFNTWSKNVVTDGPITLAEAYANTVVLDARSLTGSAAPGWANFDPSDGEVYMLIGDGDNTALQLCYSDGSTWNFQALDLQGESIELTNDDNNMQWACHRYSANSYRFWVNRTNGGTWQVAQYSTTDKGATTTYDGVISQDDTKKHQRITPARNNHYNSGGIKALAVGRVLSGTDLDFEIFDVTT